jgi:hypothetical protein
MKFDKIEFETIVGSRPEGSGAEWMTDEDWKKHDEYVERCKLDGSYGTKQRQTLFVMSDPIFDNCKNNNIVLDESTLVKFEINDLSKTKILGL